MADRGITDPAPGPRPEDAAAWAGAVVEGWRDAGSPPGTAWAKTLRVSRVSTSERRRLMALLKERSGERMSNHAIAALFGVSSTQANEDWRLVQREADRMSAFLREAGDAVRGAVDAAAARQAASPVPARVGMARKRIGALVEELEALDMLLRESLS